MIEEILGDEQKGAAYIQMKPTSFNVILKMIQLHREKKSIKLS